MSENLTESQSIAKQLGYAYWDEHPEYPVSDWTVEVVNYETRLSYWEWVESRMEDD